jgi:hypothetical protein
VAEFQRFEILAEDFEGEFFVTAAEETAVENIGIVVVELLLIVAEEGKELTRADEACLGSVEILEEDVGVDGLELFAPGVEDLCAPHHHRHQKHKLPPYLRTDGFSLPFAFSLRLEDLNLVDEIFKRDEPAPPMIEFLEQIIEFSLIAGYSVLRILSQTFNAYVVFIS